jgi:hypothetical protein
MAALTNSDDASAVRKELANGREQTDGGFFRLIIILGVVFLLSAALVMAEKGDSHRGFYGRFIDREIARCEHVARIYSAATNLTALNGQAVEKARFYKENRDRLIASMEERNLGKDPQRVEYFLYLAVRNVFRFAKTAGISDESKGVVGRK